MCSHLGGIVTWNDQKTSPDEYNGSKWASMDHLHEKDMVMVLDDKIGNAAEDAKGKAKEAAGRATDDDSLVAEALLANQTKADFKKAGENITDAFKH